MSRTRQSGSQLTLRRYRAWFYLRLTLIAFPFLFLGMLMVALAVWIQPALVEQWKEVLLVFGTGISTLTAAYVVGMLEHNREREREFRQVRRERAQPYRTYLMNVMVMIQRAELAADFAARGWTSEFNTVRVSQVEREEMLVKIPPLEDFSAIDDDSCRDAVDTAISLGLRYARDSSDGEITRDHLRHAFTDALRQLDYYENLV